MGFSSGAIRKAEDRQDKYDGLGTWCARCCENIGLAKSCVIPRIPIDKGGPKKAENCVVLCHKCYSEIGEAHPSTIPYSELPCFKVERVLRY